MWTRFAATKLRARDLMAEAATAMQQEKSWPRESPHKEVLELLRESEGMRLEGTTVIRQAMKGGRACDWSELLKSDKLNADGDRRSIAHQILPKSTDVLRRIIVPVGGQGGVTLSYVCPHCHRFPPEDNIWWVSTEHGKKQSNWWCTACGGQYDWRRALVILDSTDCSEAKALPTPRRLVSARTSCAHSSSWQISNWEVIVLCRCWWRVFRNDEDSR